MFCCVCYNCWDKQVFLFLDFYLFHFFEVIVKFGSFGSSHFLTDFLLQKTQRGGGVQKTREQTCDSRFKLCHQHTVMTSSLLCWAFRFNFCTKEGSVTVAAIFTEVSASNTSLDYWENPGLTSGDSESSPNQDLCWLKHRKQAYRHFNVCLQTSWPSAQLARVVMTETAAEWCCLLPDCLLLQGCRGEEQSGASTVVTHCSHPPTHTQYIAVYTKWIQLTAEISIIPRYFTRVYIIFLITTINFNISDSKYYIYILGFF